jgi:2-polyprenyl-6-methoxyphenol hydroxylase-like FAD-dependent oxidoreductase
MFGADEMEVLVAGAGPVGMLTALRLVEGGVKVKIIDEAWGTGTHSYACALHPETLGLLREMGLADEVLAHGQRVDKIGFYEGRSRKAELELSRLRTDYPFALVLPQSALEGLLEQRLVRHGVKVHWNHRLSQLTPGGDEALAVIDRLEGTVSGYSVPTWDWVVTKRYEVRPRFVVGADGHDSLVRRALGTECVRGGKPAVYGIYEAELEQELEPEARVVLDEATVSVLWPLPGRRCRWSFQLLGGESVGGFPGKERHLWRFYDETVDHQIAEQLRGHLQRRAPWFDGKVKEVNWSIAVSFEPRLARSFGRDRCWLVGDAAHQTSPVGVQSMNNGLQEATDLAEALRRMLRKPGSQDLLAQYNLEHHTKWEWLLGLTGEVKAGDKADGWIAQHRTRLLSCLPASGPHLDALLEQAGLECARAQPAVCGPGAG